MNVIDVWAQHPNPLFLAQPFLDSLKRWTGNALSEIPLDVTVEQYRSAGVGKALLSAWYGPEGTLVSNEEVLGHVRAHPDLFDGIASADVRNPVEAVKTIREYVTQHGFKGVRIVQWLWELPSSHALFYPIYAACVELGVPVCLQVGLTGPLRSSESGRPIHIERVALDFPDLKIVCGHLGYPWTTEMIAFATKFPNVYIDTSAYKPKRYPAELVSYMKANGRRKVMFGTNYPMISPSACLDELSVLDLDGETRDAFLFENAKRVFAL